MTWSGAVAIRRQATRRVLAGCKGRKGGNAGRSDELPGKANFVALVSFNAVVKGMRLRLLAVRGGARPRRIFFLKGVASAEDDKVISATGPNLNSI